MWNVESTSKLDYKGASTPMGPSGPYFELICYDDMVYEGWIDTKFIFVHKDILIIM